MSTVNKAFAENIKRNNGFYNGDDDQSLGDNPRCIEITEYDNAYSGVGFGLTFEGRTNAYQPSDFVGNPRRFWKYEPA